MISHLPIVAGVVGVKIKEGGTRGGI